MELRSWVLSAKNVKYTRNCEKFKIRSNFHSNIVFRYSVVDEMLQVDKMVPDFKKFRSVFGELWTRNWTNYGTRSFQKILINSET